MTHDLVMLGEHGGDDSAELVVEDCFICPVLDSSRWTAEDWVKKSSSGIWLGRHGRRHVARNNYVLNTRFGINLCAPECLCEGNVVANSSADEIRATRDGQTVQYNVIKNSFDGEQDGDGNHDDGIQVFLFNKGTGTLRNITLRGNLILARETSSGDSTSRPSAPGSLSRRRPKSYGDAGSSPAVGRVERSWRRRLPGKDKMSVSDSVPTDPSSSAIERRRDGPESDKMS